MEIINQVEYFLLCLKKISIIIPKPIKMIISGMIIGNDIKLIATKNLFPYILSLGDNIDMNDVLIGACIGGHLKMVYYAISKGADDLNSGLYEACNYGYMEIVELMIYQGADKLNRGLYAACRYGHKKIVIFFDF